jgi:cysteine desulfuration protein SufE
MVAGENTMKIVFTADSDAILTKIINFDSYFSNQTAKSILEADMGFIDAIGLKEHLSPTRANGLVSMIKNIKML